MCYIIFTPSGQNQDSKYSAILSKIHSHRLLFRRLLS